MADEVLANQFMPERLLILTAIRAPPPANLSSKLAVAIIPTYSKKSLTPSQRRAPRPPKPRSRPCLTQHEMALAMAYYT